MNSLFYLYVELYVYANEHMCEHALSCNQVCTHL